MPVSAHRLRRWMDRPSSDALDLVAGSSVGNLPDHEAVHDALTFARRWSTGPKVGAYSTLGHAVQVASVLRHHVECLPPDVVVVALLHDAAHRATDVGPYVVDQLRDRFGYDVTRAVQEMRTAHTAADAVTCVEARRLSEWTVWVIAADNVVTLGAVLQKRNRLADEGSDPAAAWRGRTDLEYRMPYFLSFCQLAAPHLPPRLATALRHNTAHAAAESARLHAARTRGPSVAVTAG